MSIVLTGARLEIQSLFDAQIRGVMGQIREQLNWFSEHGKVDQVVCPSKMSSVGRRHWMIRLSTRLPQEFVILSGGLGSSAYVRQSIEQQLVRSPHPNAIQAVVVPCQDPQLVVVRGLLLDHQQKSGERQQSVLATRVARASYGVVIRQLYSPARHFNEEVVPDEFVPKRLWALNQIQWMIRKVCRTLSAKVKVPLCSGHSSSLQGDVIDVNSPLAKQFEFHLADGETTRSWDTDIVISQNEASFLPTSMKQGKDMDCLILLNVTTSRDHG